MSGEEQFRSWIERTSDSQFEGVHNLNARKELYKFAEPSIDIYEEILKKLEKELSGSEEVLEVGCGDGDFLYSGLYKTNKHEGFMLGIDPKENWRTTEEKIRQENPQPPLEPTVPIAFIKGRAEDILRKFNQFDVVIANFSINHMDDYKEILELIRQVLRPRGKLVVAQRGMNNMRRLWESADEVARKLALQGYVPVWPQQFYSVFDLNIAKRILPVLFNQEFYFEQSAAAQGSHLNIPPIAWDKVEAAALSTFHREDTNQEPPDYQVPEEKIREAIREVLKPTFDEEVAKEGLFKLEVEQGFFYLRNRK